MKRVLMYLAPLVLLAFSSLEAQQPNYALFDTGRLGEYILSFIDSLDICIPSTLGTRNDSCVYLSNSIHELLSGCNETYCNGDKNCPNHQSCVNHQCIDPCKGACGVNANCTVVQHLPHCDCPEGYTGDKFLLCTKIDTALLDEETGKVKVQITVAAR